jgi:hypothetical protein
LAGEARHLHKSKSYWQEGHGQRLTRTPSGVPAELLGHSVLLLPIIGFLNFFPLDFVLPEFSAPCDDQQVRDSQVLSITIYHDGSIDFDF